MPAIIESLRALALAVLLALAGTAAASAQMAAPVPALSDLVSAAGPVAPFAIGHPNHRAALRGLPWLL